MREVAAAFRWSPGTVANVLQGKGTSYALFSSERRLTHAQQHLPAAGSGAASALRQAFDNGVSAGECCGKRKSLMDAAGTLVAVLLLRAKEQIEKLNASNAIFVSSEFLKLKLEELYLTHEYREKLKAERDERAEAVRLAREEQKLRRDMEEAQEQEEHYARLLGKAKAEAANIVGPKLAAFADQIEVLERDLAEARAKVARAQAMAERTRSGYVYIISNIGSFGEGVVKIGLTRRLDPLDRVRELGDASVPFVFDTHVIIYSDDAPSLERALHAEFEPTRINAQNYRKEFFRASLDAVEAAVQRLAPDAPFFKDVEAQEYRETLFRRRQALENVDTVPEPFPAEI